MPGDYLTGLPDTALVELASDLQPGVWGSSGTITVGDQNVFAKRVPVTDLEVAKPYSTRNHFRLPTFYSYGVGSAGMAPGENLPDTRRPRANRASRCSCTIE
jgi:hypothetical protein